MPGATMEELLDNKGIQSLAETLDPKKEIKEKAEKLIVAIVEKFPVLDGLDIYNLTGLLTEDVSDDQNLMRVKTAIEQFINENFEINHLETSLEQIKKDLSSLYANQEKTGNKKLLSQIQAEHTTWRTNVSWANNYNPNALITSVDVKDMKFGTTDNLTADPKRKGGITHINQETPANLPEFFEKTKPTTFITADLKADKNFAPLFKDSAGKDRTPQRHEILQVLIDKEYYKKYYIPGIDYKNWIMANPYHPNAEALKHSKWNLFPASLFRDASGHLNVPSLRWCGSTWNPNSHWLGYDWNDDIALVLLER